MILFSIIVPIYNVEKYLRDCLESIFSQRCEGGFEVILVDDGSTDSSGSIADEYGDRAIVIHKENGGLSSARNAGLDAAQGQWIVFVDSDDMMMPDALAVLERTVLNNEKTDIVSFNVQRIDVMGQFVEKVLYGPENISIGLLKSCDRKEFVLQKFLKYKFGWEACNRIFKRGLIEEYGIRFVDTKEVFAEDLQFSLSYLRYCNHYTFICNILYQYRINPDSILGSLDKTTVIPRLFNLLESLDGYDYMPQLCFEMLDYQISYLLKDYPIDQIRYQLIEASCHQQVKKWMKKIAKYEGGRQWTRF